MNNIKTHSSETLVKVTFAFYNKLHGIRLYDSKLNKWHKIMQPTTHQFFYCCKQHSNMSKLKSNIESKFNPCIDVCVFCRRNMFLPNSGI